VLVTGASTGIGEACALRMAERGWTVLAGVRKEEDGERLRAAGGGRVRPVRLDVTDEADIAAVRKQVEHELGDAGLHGLVNNAGVARGGPLEFLPVDDWRAQLEVNVVGQVAVTRALLPSIRRAKGRIVFIGSIAGRVAGPLLGPYSASKHALEAVAETLRHELADFGVKVVLVEPGVVKTPIWSKGRARADELEGDLPPEARQLYGEQMDRLRQGIETNDKGGVPASKVADVVERGLAAANPRPRYLVGPDALVAGNLTRVLPDRIRDNVFRRLSGR
jgi:NAD(P)-dependent dehydrogenase (short-subunit alcohol dehydrogenase family)